MKMSVRLSCLAAVLLTSLSLHAQGRELAPRPLATTSYASYTQRVAFARDRFLTVWQEGMGAIGSPLLGSFSDGDGRRVSERAFAIDVPTFRGTYAMDLIGVGDAFALFWRDNADRMQMARIELDGRVTAVRSLAIPSTMRAEYAWNGTHFLAVVVHGHPARVEAFLFDREGRSSQAPIAIAHSTYVFELVVAGGRFVAFTGSRGSFRLQVIAADGTVRSEEIPVRWATSPERVVAAANERGDVLFVWSSGSELSSGIYRADDSFASIAGLRGGRRTAAVALMRAGDGYVVAFTADQSLYGMRLDAAGAQAAEPELAAEQVYSPHGAAAGTRAMLIAYAPPDLATGMFVAVQADARARAPEVISIRPAGQSQPVLSAGGGSVLAAWTETAGRVAAVRAAVVDAAGNTRPVVSVGRGVLAARELAWNGVHHLVTRYDGTDLLATRIGADGSVFDEQPILVAKAAPYVYERFASAVWAGDRWIVLSMDLLGFTIRSVSSGGVVAVVATVPLRNRQHFVESLAIGFDGRTAVAVWREELIQMMPGTPGPRRTYAMRLTGEGEPFGNVVELQAPQEATLSVASSGDEFMVVAGTGAFVLEADRSELHLVRARDLFNWPASSDVTWDGRDYVVALRYRLAQHHLALLRLDRLAFDAGLLRGTPTLPPYWFEPPSVAAPFAAGSAMVGVQEGTADEGVRAAVYLEEDLRPLAPPPAAPSHVEVRKVSGAYSWVSWNPSPTGEPEIYVIEVQRTFPPFWVEAARVPGSAQGASVYALNDGLVRVRAVNAGGVSEPAVAEPTQLRKRRSVAP